MLAQVDPATARYYLPSAGSGATAVPVTGPEGAHSYYRGGAFLPDGDLFLSLDGAAPFKLTTGLGAAAWT